MMVGDAVAVSVGVATALGPGVDVAVAVGVSVTVASAVELGVADGVSAGVDPAVDVEGDVGRARGPVAVAALVGLRVIVVTPATGVELATVGNVDVGVSEPPGTAVNTISVVSVPVDDGVGEGVSVKSDWRTVF